MKILMATMKMEIGGAETHILELARELVRRGHSVTVISAGGVFVPELEASGVRHLYAPLHTRRPDCVARAYAVLRRAIRDGGYDVVHAHARIPALLCHLLCRRYRVRFVTTAHLNFHVNFMWRLLSKWGERTIAVSDDIKRYLIDDYGVCADNISVTINGIDTRAYTPDMDAQGVAKELALTDGAPCVVCVSRMDTDRSAAPILLAEIAPDLCMAHPGLEIVLVGDGNDRERLMQAADAANAQIGRRAVILTGARTDINRLIAAGDLFVGVSRAALEAMAMAKPVVLAGNQGYLGLFTEDKLAVAYESNFCCRGADALSRDSLLFDVSAALSMTADERVALGAVCRDVVLKHYSVSRMAEDYLAVYESVRPFSPFRHGDLLFCGYYGFGNMGDDSLLRAIITNLRTLQPDVRITVMSKAPKQTRARYGTNAVNRFSVPAVLCAMRHARVLVFGGGNLLQDGSSARSILYYTWILKMAKRCGCKIMVYANGIGPLHLEKSRKAAAQALSIADVITLREEDSVRECEALGVRCPDIRLTADPVFTLHEAEDSWVRGLCAQLGILPEKRYFALALRDWKTDRAENAERMARICDAVSTELGLIPVFLPMHDPLDVDINRTVAGLCQCETIVVSGLVGGEMLGILRRMEFVAAMRLHTLIYACAVGTPGIELAYDRKLRAFMQRTGQPFTLDEPDLAMFLSAARALCEEREAYSAPLRALREEFSALSMQDARLALSLLE